jgi:hypothetical protein
MSVKKGSEVGQGNILIGQRTSNIKKKYIGINLMSV